MSKLGRVPHHTLGTPENPLWPLQKPPFPTQSAFKGDILEEAIQTASNEFLTTNVVRGKAKEPGNRETQRERPLLIWFVGSPLSGSKRPPASDHQGVKCAQWGSPSAPHSRPNDVWNVLIKCCLFIRLTMGFMGWALSGSASYCPRGNSPDGVTSLTSRWQIFNMTRLYTFKWALISSGSLSCSGIYITKNVSGSSLNLFMAVLTSMWDYVSTTWIVYVELIKKTWMTQSVLLIATDYLLR